MTTERWLPIPGYEGSYDVSDQGRVRSWVSWRDGPLPHTLKQNTNLGYKRLMLCRPGEPGVTWKVHQLVMLAFVGPRPKGWHTRHLDGDGTNNNLTNLTYGTASENQYDRVRLGTHTTARRDACAAGHLYDEANTRRDKKGARVCRECQRGYCRAYKRRRTQQREAA